MCAPAWSALPPLGIGPDRPARHIVNTATAVHRSSKARAEPGLPHVVMVVSSQLATVVGTRRVDRLVGCEDRARKPRWMDGAHTRLRWATGPEHRSRAAKTRRLNEKGPAHLGSVTE